MNDGTNAPHQAAHHRSIDEVKEDLRIGPWLGVLLWLSKTEYHALSLCPMAARNTLASLGMMVIFKTALAFASSLYTLKTAVVPPGMALAWPISFVLAVIYAYGIMIIDREIVGATSTSIRAQVIRLIFACVVATAVSYPVKLLFFEGRIGNEIDQMLEEEHAPKIERIEYLKSTIDKELLEQREAIKSQIADIDNDIKVLDDEINREANIVHCGPKCQELLAQKEEKRKQKLELVERLNDLATTGALPPPILKEINKLEAEMKARRAAAYDFLYKTEALDRIAEEVGSSYQFLSIFIFVFFLLLETVPVFLKWALGKTEYHYYIEARTQLNNQKIVSWANLYLKWMQDNGGDRKALEQVPNEVTDTIASVMEDEATPARRRETNIGDEPPREEADPIEGPTPPDEPRGGSNA